MCAVCETEARNTADQNAAATSARLAGHGRAAHGRDAGRRRRNAEENQEDNIQAAWNLIYNQTLRRLQALPHPRT